MIIKYDILFEVNVLHEYYKGGLTGDFVIVPTTSCMMLLDRYKLIYRQAETGFKIFAPVLPATDPPQLQNPLEGASLKFAFMVHLKNSYFDGISALPDFNPSRELFYFSNLYEDIEDDTRYLGDHLDGKRVGYPIKAIRSNNLNYRFKHPVNAAQFGLVDLFDNQYNLQHPDFSFPDPNDKVDSFQHNLGVIDGFKEGRYLMTDDQAGQLPFYYDRSLYARDVFGIIEIYSNTGGFTDPPNNLVPASYRFVENDAISGKGNYNLGFASSAWKWMFVCLKNPENIGNGIDVSNLTVEGPVAFSKVGGDDVEERRILSDDPITSAEEPVSIILKHNGIKIRGLPNPVMGSILKKDNNEIYYEMYIYV
ncbi:MAG: hypothetical protein B6D64_06445 [Bacteroidetes bacterium 4484_276]|nr:MAG: hypothetical protein B6D64_06445 [Bacteroidetes bacterium 4484_276]